MSLLERYFPALGPSARLALALVVVAGCLGCSGSEKTAAESAIIVVVDTLRADHLGCLGYDRSTSPFIDTLARQGVVFSRAQATAPWTVPSTATIMTGLFPTEHGAEVTGEIRHLKPDSPLQQMGESVESLGRSLLSAGFRTGLFSANPFLFGRFQDGFEVAEVGRMPASELTDKVLDFLGSVQDRRFFIHLQYMDLHEPIEPPDRFLNMFPVPYPGPRADKYKGWSFPEPTHWDSKAFEIFRAHKIAVYDGALRYIDTELERLYRGLEEMGLAESTLIVITSDHGEEFWDHAEAEFELGGDPRGIYGIAHGHSMFQEQLRVPLIFSGSPVATGRQIDVPVSLVDVAPTVLDLLAEPAPDSVSGRSLRPHLDRRQTPVQEARPLYSESPAYGPESWSLVVWPFKVILRGDEKALLFNLEQDPLEQQDLSALEPERLATMLDRLRAFQGRLQASDPSTKMDIDEETQEQLESLGYLE